MTQPTELRLRDGGRTLEIDWDDGRASRLSAPRLRDACRCAGCTRAGVDGRAAPADAAITIVAVDPVGGYGVNLGFSDGHARGIFPWRYLREIDDAITCSTAADRAASVSGSPATLPNQGTDA
jgi:DUF971 family protein